MEHILVVVYTLLMLWSINYKCTCQRIIGCGIFDCVNAEWVLFDQTVQVAGSVHNVII